MRMASGQSRRFDRQCGVPRVSRNTGPTRYGRSVLHSRREQKKSPALDTAHRSPDASSVERAGGPEYYKYPI